MYKTVLEAMTFTNAAGENSYGFVIGDDYDNTYDNNSECKIVDDLELLRYVVECCERQMSSDEKDTSVLVSILSNIVENELGLRIGKVFYDFDEIEEVLEVINERIR